MLIHFEPFSERHHIKVRIPASELPVVQRQRPCFRSHPWSSVVHWVHKWNRLEQAGTGTFRIGLPLPLLPWWKKNDEKWQFNDVQSELHCKNCHFFPMIPWSWSPDHSFQHRPTVLLEQQVFSLQTMLQTSICAIAYMDQMVPKSKPGPFTGYSTDSTSLFTL